MQTFREWAEAVDQVVESQLGRTYLATSIFEDAATWKHIVNTAKAWPSPDGLTIHVRYNDQDQHQQIFPIAGNAALDGARIADTLGGLV